MVQRDRLLAMRATLFLFGLAIVALGLSLPLSGLATDGHVLLFTVCDALILFSVVVGPLLAGGRIEDATAGRIVLASMVPHATMPYAMCTTGLVLYANLAPQPPVRLLVVVQLALTFAMALWIYYGVRTSAHIEDVARYEAAVRSSVEGLRRASEQLAECALRADTSQCAGLDALAATIGQVAEELRYLTPVLRQEADEAERQIGLRLSSLDAWYRAEDFTPTRVQEASDLACETLTLIGTRKAMRN